MKTFLSHCTGRLSFFVLLALFLPRTGLTQNTTEVDLTQLVNTDITTYTNGTDYPLNGGSLAVGGIPFTLATIAPDSDTAILQGSDSSLQSYTIPVNAVGVTTVYTLMNSIFGSCGTTIGELDFVGANSGTFVYSLVEGSNIRDHNNSGFCDTATNIAGTANFGGDQVRFDMQQIVLPASFANDTLVSVTMQSYGLGGNGAPFMAAMTTVASSALQFVGITPCRVIDTRGPQGPFGAPELYANTINEFDLPSGSCGIPSTAAAYSLNVTVVPDGSLGYLTVWPSGQPQPNSSTLNSDGRTKANAAIVGAGTNGGIDVYVSDSTQLVVDISGYFVPSGSAQALDFYPVSPCRIADTRQANGPLGGPYIAGNTSRDFPIQSSNCGLPAGAQSYSLNVTAVPHSTLNYLTIWPTDQQQPYVSTLNALTGATTANAAIVPAAVNNGDVSVYVSDDADVVLDVNGYFASPASGGLSLYETNPCRSLDTRQNGAFNGVITVGVSSACVLPVAAQAYVVNATVLPSSSLNYLTLWPDQQVQPYVSTLNALDGATTSNMAIVPTTNGTIDAFGSDPTNLIVDLTGYFAP